MFKHVWPLINAWTQQRILDFLMGKALTDFQWTITVGPSATKTVNVRLSQKRDGSDIHRSSNRKCCAVLEICKYHRDPWVHWESSNVGRITLILNIIVQYYFWDMCLLQFLSFKICFHIENHCKRLNEFSDLPKITRIFWTLRRVFLLQTAPLKTSRFYELNYLLWEGPSVCRFPLQNTPTDVLDVRVYILHLPWFKKLYPNSVGIKAKTDTTQLCQSVMPCQSTIRCQTLRSLLYWI